MLLLSLGISASLGNFHFIKTFNNNILTWKDKSILLSRTFISGNLILFSRASWNLIHHVDNVMLLRSFSRIKFHIVPHRVKNIQFTVGSDVMLIKIERIKKVLLLSAIQSTLQCVSSAVLYYRLNAKVKRVYISFGGDCQITSLFHDLIDLLSVSRSEERRVGKEC